MVKVEPIRVWRIASAHLSDRKIDSLGFHILQWLRGDQHIGGKSVDGALLSIPREAIWNWIDEAPDPRAYMIAHYCPKEIERKDGGPSFALELLERYGDHEEIRRAMSANFHSEGWMGPASAHYQGKLTHVEEMLRTEKHPNVRIWLVNEADLLRQQIRHEEINEERRGF